MRDVPQASRDQLYIHHACPHSYTGVAMSPTSNGAPADSVSEVRDSSFVGWYLCEPISLAEGSQRPSCPALLFRKPAVITQAISHDRAGCGPSLRKQPWGKQLAGAQCALGPAEVLESRQQHREQQGRPLGGKGGMTRCMGRGVCPVIQDGVHLSCGLHVSLSPGRVFAPSGPQGSAAHQGVAGPQNIVAGPTRRVLSWTMAKPPPEEQGQGIPDAKSSMVQVGRWRGFTSGSPESF